MPAVTRARLFRVSVAVDEERLKRMRRTPELLAAAIRAGAEYWHDKVMPRHFEKSAHGEYGYAPRSHTYLKDRRKGSKPDLVFSGSMRRDAIHNVTYKEMSQGVIELKMRPRVLNLVPNIPNNSEDLYVKHKGGRGYPNLKRELKAITDDEREAVAGVIVGTYELAMAPSGGHAESD